MLRGHCEREGRDYDEIEKTVMMGLDPGPNGENIDAMHRARSGARGARRLGGARHRAPTSGSSTPLNLLGREVVPAIADW